MDFLRQKPRNNIDDLERELLALARAEHRLVSRNQFYGFITYTMPGYIASWHNAVLAKYLDAFAKKLIKRLIICMGPRMGKTQQVSRHLPAYLFGRNPNEKIIAISHSSMLARKNNRDVQRIIDDDKYMQLFPGTTLFGRNSRISESGSYLRNSEEFEIVGYDGRYFARGIGQGVVGSGAGFILVDDPIKSVKEAYSKTYQRTLIDYYQGELYPRLNDENGSILLTHTRWHQNDLVGFLQSLQKLNPSTTPWTVLNFPQIRTLDSVTVVEDPREPGSNEVLWPGKFGPKFMSELRVAMGPRMWAAQQMGTPMAEGGNTFKREWIRYFDIDAVTRQYILYRSDKPPLRVPFDAFTWFAYVDPSVEKKDTSDKMAMLAIGFSDDYHAWLVIDAVQEREEVIKQDRKVRDFSFRNKCARAKVENEKAGKFLRQMSEKYNQTGDDGILAHDAIPYDEVSTEGLSKESRAVQMAIHMEMEKVFFLRGAHWLQMLEDQLLSFPTGSEDHLVDCLSMARFSEPEDESPASVILSQMLS